MGLHSAILDSSETKKATDVNRQPNLLDEGTCDHFLLSPVTAGASQED
jgi:hypothetical protein